MKYLVFSDKVYQVRFDLTPSEQPKFTEGQTEIKDMHDFSNEIKSKAISIDKIGHMGKKSGLEELPEVINIVLNG